MFTGDESGNFLFRALFEAGLASQPESRRPGDGLALSGALVSAACRCAPPNNRPLPEEQENCREYLERELALLPPRTVLVALGALAFAACLKILARSGAELPRPRPRFAHGAVYSIGEHRLLGSYHPSQQNTFTGKLTPVMLREVLRRAVKEAQTIASGNPSPRPAGRSLRETWPAATAGAEVRRGETPRTPPGGRGSS
jgi:uracil-DNA glycosylase family 4